ncbi:hypothetical protein RRG08_008697 [Elysia crispata]|uniref:Uncharacterized protein n=1 Tax=Elysia crispata TaxID=231223 RepID=A0AAE1CJV1_9GAST|nr:hypothetical protein RRG08_008697 [Elysia crispata]
MCKAIKKKCSGGPDRHPPPEMPQYVPLSEYVRQIFSATNRTPATSTDIATKDSIFHQVFHFTAHGWADKSPEKLKPFFSRTSELRVNNDNIL